jgi:proton glutamate symport protein
MRFSMFRSLSVRVLLALAAGLVVGALAQGWGDGAKGVLGVVEGFGGLWLNLLRMTVVPLVFCLLVTGAASATDAASTSRLAGRSVALFAALILISGIYATLAVNGALALWPLDAQSAAALRAGAGSAGPPPAALPSFAEWLATLAPANPIKAAAEDAILPLVVFALLTGLAATQIADNLRQALLGVVQAVAEAMTVIVRWVLVAAPLGVFALSLGVGLRAGFGAAGALVHYVIVVAGVTFGVSAIPYVLIALHRARGGRTSLAAFTRAVAPVQVLAVSTQSSLACLPAMIERAQTDLGISPRVAGLVLPLAVALFRLTSCVANLGVVYFVLHVYGITPSLPQVAAGVFVAFAMSIGTVGLPGQVSFFASITPICLTLGAPLELLPLLLAVEVVPDIFRTIGNVTGDLACAAVLADDGQEKSPPV